MKRKIALLAVALMVGLTLASGSAVAQDTATVTDNDYNLNANNQVNKQAGYTAQKQLAGNAQVASGANKTAQFAKTNATQDQNATITQDNNQTADVTQDLYDEDYNAAVAEVDLTNKDLAQTN
jgi:hypothetical protein